MRRRIAPTAGAACLAVALVACGGGGDQDAGDESGSADATSSQDAGPTEVPDPCSLVSDEQASEVVGAEVAGEPVAGTDSTAGVASCGFAPTVADDEPGDGGGGGEAPSLDVQTSSAAGASFEDVRAGFTGGENTRVDDVETPEGSDGAILVTEEDDLLDVATAVALRDDVIYVVLGSSTDIEEAQRVARDGLEAALG